MQLNVIVIEDEPLATKKLLNFIDKVDYLRVYKTFDNAIAAISYLKNNSIDLIFLDIQMEEFTGIQFLETLVNRPKVIITTAYDKYALKGYELDVADYLLKPYTFDRFLKAVEKVSLSKPKDKQIADDYIFIKTEYRLEKVKIPDILYVEGMGEYLKIVSEGKHTMSLLNFKTLEAQLPKSNFIRVHKSYLVAIDKIDSIERGRIRIGEFVIAVSETYKEEFFERIGARK